jgi:hypothetical protein
MAWNISSKPILRETFCFCITIIGNIAQSIYACLCGVAVKNIAI